METTPALWTAALLLSLGLLTSCGGDADTSPYAGAAPTSTEETSDASDSADAVEETSDVADATDAAAGAADDADSDDAASDDAASDGAVTLTISDFEFDVPATVAPGAEITVTNQDDVGHTVTSDDDGATFDVAVGPGETVTFAAPDEPGEFAFHCRPHPAMTGTLVVEA